MIAGKGVVVPNEKNATDEDWEKFYASTGRPEAADKYELKLPEAAKDLKLNPEFEKGFREKIHKLGLNKRQAAGLFGWYMESAAQMNQGNSQAVKKRGETMQSELATDWGGDFDSNVNKASVAFSEFVTDPKEVDWMKNTKIDGLSLAQHPMMARILARVGDGLSEDKMREGLGGNIGKSKSELEKEIADLTLDSAGPYNTPSHPKYHWTRQHVLTLRQEINKLDAAAKKKK